MSVPSVIAAHSLGPDTMDLGRKIPGQADFIALGEAIRENAERRATRYARIEDQQRFLEYYAPLSYEGFLNIIKKYDQLLIQLAEETEKANNANLEQAKNSQQGQRILITHWTKVYNEDMQALEKKRNEYNKLMRKYDTRNLEAESYLNREEQRLKDYKENLSGLREYLIEDERNAIENLVPVRIELAQSIQRFIDLGGAKRFKPNIEGYKQYLVALSPSYSAAIEELGGKADLPEAARDFHTLLVAPSGWGKSELLKQIVHHYVRHNSAGIVILDPHGDFTKQVTSWPELVNADRLVWVDPNAERGFVTGINPFDNLALRDEEDRKALAQVWTEIIGENTLQFTMPMRRVCNNCIRVLLGWDRPTSLMDLKYLLEDPEQAPKNPKSDPLASFRGPAKGSEQLAQRMRRQGQLHAFAQNYPDVEIQRFFRSEFLSVGVSSSREALRNRIDLLMQLPFAEAMLTGTQTLNLRAALDAKKTIVVNLDYLRSNEAKKIVGGLWLGMISAIGSKRSEEDRTGRVPIQVIIDEAAIIVTPVLTRLITQMRKFGIHVTLAQQTDGQGYTSEQRDEMLACTQCKIVGKSEVAEKMGLADRGVRLDAVPMHHFWMRWGDGSPLMLLHVHGNLVNEMHSAGAAARRAHFERGKAAGLYRPNYPPPAQIDTPEPEELLAPEPVSDPETAEMPIPDPPAPSKPVRPPAKRTTKALRSVPAAEPSQEPAPRPKRRSTLVKPPDA